MKKITLAVFAGLILVAVGLLLSRWCAPATKKQEVAAPVEEQKVPDTRGEPTRERFQPSPQPPVSPQPSEQPELTSPPPEPIEAPKEAEPEVVAAPKELNPQANPYLRSPWAMLGLLRRLETPLQNGFAEEMEGLESLIALREDLTYEIEENADLGRPNSPELAQEFAELEEEERALMQELAARPELQRYFNYPDGQN